jgi:hypothetical protein
MDPVTANMSAYQIPILIALVLIFGSSVVILISRYLKQHNEQLRRLSREFAAGREAEQKLLSLLAAQYQQVQTSLTSAREHAAGPQSLLPPAPDAPPEPQRALSRAAAPAEQLQPEAPRVIAKKNWDTLISPRPGKAATTPAPPLETATKNRSGGAPTGPGLERWIAGQQRFSGLVVSIGVDAPPHTDRRAIAAAIQLLLQPGEVGGSVADGEYVLLMPAERGASAQRRLSNIAQQLWDLQLGPLSESGVQYTWGGVEARDEVVEDAVAGASERMRETRRGRQSFASTHT